MRRSLGSEVQEGRNSGTGVGAQRGAETKARDTGPQRRQSWGGSGREREKERVGAGERDGDRDTERLSRERETEIERKVEGETCEAGSWKDRQTPKTETQPQGAPDSGPCLPLPLRYRPWERDQELGRGARGT